MFLSSSGLGQFLEKSIVKLTQFCTMRDVLRYRAKRLAGFFKAEALREMAVPDACRFLPEKVLFVRDSTVIIFVPATNQYRANGVHGPRRFAN
ncbi:MAG: hypothetical protein ACK5N9_07695 [Pirellula sp.]